MIYQPRNVQPSNTSIDGTVANAFRMKLSTNSSVVAYKLTILDFSNNVFYTGNKVVLDTPLYNNDELGIEIPASIGLVNGNDYKWSLQLYQSTADMAITYGAVQATSTTTNIYLQSNINIKAGMKILIGSQTREISSYNSTTGLAVVSSAFSTAPSIGTVYKILSDFISTVPEYIVHVRSNPVVTITNLPTVLDKRKLTFIGSYEQEQGVPLSYFQWNLYRVTNGISTLIDTTGRQYSANIQYEYTGFKTDQTYQIELIVENDYGVIITAGAYTFSVSYEVIDYLEQPTAILNEDNSIRIDWVSPIQFPCTVSRNMAYGFVMSTSEVATQFYIEPNKTIYAGDVIVINEYYSATIRSYNAYNGLVELESAFESYTPKYGDIYYVTHIITDDSAIPILADTPYSPVHSANLDNIAVTYGNENIGYPIGEWPETFNFTMQFRPGENFFYGVNGIYNNLIEVAECIITDDSSFDNGDSIRIIVNKYTLDAIKNAKDSAGNIIIDTTMEGTTNQSIILNHGDFDSSVCKYICFINTGYTEEISYYDSETKTITLAKPLPFIPDVDDMVSFYSTMSVNLYEGVNDTWCVQLRNIINNTLDYVWTDDATWDDDGYWLEGGTEIERISGHWWKMQLQNNSLVVREGGR